LKYFSKNCLIPGPNFQISQATKKNLAPRLTNDAIKNIKRFISNTPDVTVNTLYGTRVNPAVKITQKSHWLNNALILLNRFNENPGILLKKKLANPVKSPLGEIHAKWPIEYPATAPDNVPRVSNKAYLYVFVIFSNTNARKNIGAGSGKKDASAKAQINNDHVPHIVLAH
jgi:hypothetical protein